MKYWLVLFLLLQTPSPSPFNLGYSGKPIRTEIFVASTNFKNVPTDVLVLHALETSPEMGANIEIWPSGRVKLKDKNLDKTSRDFWFSLSLVDSIKKEICK